MTDAPPSRYKVIERGRRLVVIDTRTGQLATREAARASAAAGETHAPDRGDAAGGDAVLTTSRLYDLKGPRRIAKGERLTNLAAGVLAAIVIAGTVVTIAFPMLWLGVVFALFQPKLRAAIRGWITARLDAFDASGADQAAR